MTMSGEIVGRDEELRSVYAFLDRPAEGPSALVLEGEAGIGKSTLWLAAVESACQRGLNVLSSRPAEAERVLVHAGLGDLLEEVLDRVGPLLPTPRRRALEVALLVEEAGQGVNPRTLAVAVRSALKILVADGPVVVAVDDVQWLDPSSTSALVFAIRRLRDEPVLVLLARRLGVGAESSGLERALEADRVERLRVGPLSLGATQRLLQARLGRTLARPTLLRVHETSGGNPFYALELARALDSDDKIGDPMRPLPVPETLEELVHARLAGLPAATREALVLVSAAGKPSAALLRAAEVTEDVLEPALAAHVIEYGGDGIGFAHPLLASVLYQGVSGEERRRAHELLGGIVEDQVGRARHLALSKERPDAGIAAALDDAVVVANARGAPIAAAELGEHALRLTPPEAGDDFHHRAIAAARAHFAAGEGTRARTIAVDLLARTRAGPLRAEALVLLAELESPDPVALLREALREAASRPALKALIHRRLAEIGRVTEGLQWAEEHALASLELADRLDDDGLRSGALSALSIVRFNAGDPDAPRLAEDAYELAVARGDPEQLKEASSALAYALMWSAETKKTRAFLERLHREWRDRDESASQDALWHLAWVELRAGHWALAGEYADRGRELGAVYGNDDDEMPQLLLPVALVAAHRGQLERAREHAERGRELAARRGALFAGLVAVPGLADLWSGDAASAAACFAAAERVADAAGWGEPNMRFWRADYVEALLALGRVDEALSVVEIWEADAVRVGRDWVLAQTTRCRGLVAAARGEIGEALAELDRAIAKHAEVGDPFGRARAQLALGIVRRRARQKRPAREAIEAALAGFEELGAASWAARARVELGRIGGRTQAAGLTPAEYRVASLVVEGRTNREVAAALFLGERTVASHLTHIYAKLDVRSRTELARRIR